jgi:hypothetical protein
MLNAIPEEYLEGVLEYFRILIGFKKSQPKLVRSDQ